jgi:hypothetical protein
MGVGGGGGRGGVIFTEPNEWCLKEMLNSFERV